jgi:hypothetical protein
MGYVDRKRGTKRGPRQSHRTQANSDVPYPVDIGDSDTSDPTCCHRCLVCPMPNLANNAGWVLPMGNEGYGANYGAKPGWQEPSD